jgi:hypothetical protein
MLDWDASNTIHEVRRILDNKESNVKKLNNKESKALRMSKFEDIFQRTEGVLSARKFGSSSILQSYSQKKKAFCSLFFFRYCDFERK